MSLKPIPVREETFKVLKKKKLLRELEGERLTWDDIIREMMDPNAFEKSIEKSRKTVIFSELEQEHSRGKKRAIRRKYGSAAKLPADSDYLIEKTKQKIAEGLENEAILRGLRAMGLEEDEAEAVLEAAKGEMEK
jgi:hypothetical protein